MRNDIHSDAGRWLELFVWGFRVLDQARSNCLIILSQNIIEGHHFVPSNRIVSAFVLKYSQRLIIGGPNRIFSREIVMPKPFTFDSAVCCAINTDRSQIITIDKDCLLQVWDSRSGNGM